MTTFILIFFSAIIITTCSYLIGYNKGRKFNVKEFFDKKYYIKMDPLVKDIYVLYNSEDGLKHFIYKKEGVIFIPILSVYLIYLFTEKDLLLNILPSINKEEEIYKIYGKTSKEIPYSLNKEDLYILKKILTNIEENFRANSEQN